jgi:long-chain acyl-CoA synthetase
MTAPWLDHYDAGIPRSIGAYPEKTLVDVLRDRVVANRDEIALVFKGRSMSVAELDRISDALAHSLFRLGVKHGDRVALVLPNAPQFLISQFATWKLGAIVAPQNPIYTDRELEESVGISQPDTVVTLTPFYQRIKRCRPTARIIATNVKEYFPTALRILFTLLKEKKDGHRIKLASGDLWLGDLIRDGARQGPLASQAKPHDDAMILMSGGTTGTAKGAVSDHRSLLMAGMQIATWLQEPLKKGGSLMLPLPLFHAYGSGAVLPASMCGRIPLVLVPNPRDIGDLVATIEREKPSILCAVPALLNALLAHPKVAARKADFRSLLATFSGAAPLLAETKKRFEEITGGRIVEAYSLTEATLAACVNPYLGENKIGSVGMPLPDVHVRIVDAEDWTRELPIGETGEIVIRAPQLMRRYWNDPEETATVLRRDAGGALSLVTGDLGYLDQDGYLFIVDRKKDLIKTSGCQVWPREIEEVIATHPDVGEVGVAGVPDPRRGEVVMAWVVPRGDASLTEAAIRAFCADKLAPYKIPTRVEIRKDLPKTLVGKVLRRALVAEFVARAASSS